MNNLASNVDSDSLLLFLFCPFGRNCCIFGSKDRVRHEVTVVGEGQKRKSTAKSVLKVDLEFENR